MSEGRSVWRLILNNIAKSFRQFPKKGNLMGEDYLGNKYYESLRDPKIFQRATSRWFVPKDEDWQQNLPAEWEAWLRGRRHQPPSPEEIFQNLSLAKIKKEKGDEIRMKSEKAKQISSFDTKGFPNLEGFEKDPGESYDKKNNC